MLLFDVNNNVLVRLLFLAVHFPDNHFRATYSQLKVLATHIFDQHRQVQLSTTGHLELVHAFAFFNPQGHIVQQFFFQTLFDIATGDKLALFTAERRIVDLEGHGHGGLVNGQRRQCLDVIHVTQSV